jgi:protein TonB
VPSPQVESPPKTIAPPPDLEVIRSNYGSVLSREFAKYKQYPRVAQMRGWQGTSRVELQIDATGTVTAVNIVESSGFEVLDKQAIESVRKALPLPPIPAELRGKEFTIVVPMKFSLQ